MLYVFAPGIHTAFTLQKGEYSFWAYRLIYLTSRSSPSEECQGLEDDLESPCLYVYSARPTSCCAEVSIVVWRFYGVLGCQPYHQQLTVGITCCNSLIPGTSQYHETREYMGATHDTHRKSDHTVVLLFYEIYIGEKKNRQGIPNWKEHDSGISPPN